MKYFEKLKKGFEKPKKVLKNLPIKILYVS